MRLGVDVRVYAKADRSTTARLLGDGFHHVELFGALDVDRSDTHLERALDLIAALADAAVDDARGCEAGE